MKSCDFVKVVENRVSKYLLYDELRVFLRKAQKMITTRLLVGLGKGVRFHWIGRIVKITAIASDEAVIVYYFPTRKRFNDLRENELYRLWQRFCPLLNQCGYSRRIRVKVKAAQPFV